MGFLPPFEFITSPQGVSGVFIPATKIPTVYLSLRFHTGSLAETQENLGVADFLSSLFEEGAGPYDSFTFIDELEKRGSYISFSCSHDSMYVFVASLKEYFAETMNILHTALYQPRFDKDAFEVKKNRIYSGLSRQLAQPETLNYLLSLRALYSEKSRYAMLPQGSLKNIRNASLESIRSFYTQNFLNAKMSFVVSGDISGEELFTALGSFKHSGNAAAQFEVPDAPPNNPLKTRWVVLPESIQTIITIGLISSGRKEKNHFARMIMNYIFGGNFNSRLNVAIREKGGLSYGASSSFSYNLKGGTFEIETQVETEHTAKALKIIFDEIKSFPANLTPEECEKAKTAYINRIPLRFETPMQYVSYFSSLMKYDIPAEQVGKDIEYVSNLSYDDILQSYRDEVSPENLQISLCGNNAGAGIEELPAELTGSVEIIDKELLS